MSLSPDGRSPKRQKSNLITASMANNTVDVIPNGDVLLALPEMAGVKHVKLRLSSHVLSMTSPVFKTIMANTKSSMDTPEEDVVLDTLEDEADTLYLLVNILHLRNDKLPSRLPVEALCKLAKLADKYQCATAIGRATVVWFDRLYTAAKAGGLAIESWKMIEATHLLDEPVFFRRFTEKWVLEGSLASGTLLAATRSEDATMRKLAVELHNRRQSHITALRADIDLLVDPCSVSFAKPARHYIDYAPGMMPDADDDGRVVGSICHVDEGAATKFLGALRDEHIWPPTIWQDTLGALAEQIQSFRVPEYDDVDKCEFCENVKGRFALAVDLVKKMHRDRLWGLCLDCFKAGGVNAGQCRYEHSKPKSG